MGGIGEISTYKIIISKPEGKSYMGGLGVDGVR
jgi:hypothetical protein